MKNNNLNRALGRSTVFAGRGGSVDQESSNLDLARGIECYQADIGVREGLGAGIDLLQHLGAIGAAEHGQLPHGPVAVVLVACLDRSKWRNELSDFVDRIQYIISDQKKSQRAYRR